MRSAAETLAAVGARMDEVLDDLARDWQALSQLPSDLLGEGDVPGLARAAARGGKRIRPEMVHWGWVAGGAPEATWHKVVDLGAALELLHVFALIHDDVMDASETRRGQRALHAEAREAHAARGCVGDSRAFGDHVAILAGDLVHAEADVLVATLPADVRAVWRLMVVELVLGQRQDLTGAATGRRDAAQAREVSRLKTGSYTVQRPLQMGALLAGSAPELVDALVEFGAHAGDAFGLRDDLLGTWGDPAQTGKSDLDDLAAGKATVLLATAGERLDAEGQRLLALTGTDALGPDDLTALRARMDALGVREEGERLVADSVAAARSVLDAHPFPREAADGLADVLDRIAWRKS